MKPNIDIDGSQLDTYLKSYNIETDLYKIKYRQNYSLDNYVQQVNTDIFYKDTMIEESDIIFKLNVTSQEKELILIALNKLRLKLI